MCAAALKGWISGPVEARIMGLGLVIEGLGFRV